MLVYTGVQLVFYAYVFHTITQYPVETLDGKEESNHEHKTGAQFFVESSKEDECIQNLEPRSLNQVLSMKYKPVGMSSW